jgi:hypothetical protein
MDKVRNPSNSECYTPSSEPFRIYGKKCSGSLKAREFLDSGAFWQCCVTFWYTESDILINTTFRKPDLFPSSSEGIGNTYSAESIRYSKPQSLVQWGQKQFSFQHVVLLEHWTRDKVQNPVISMNSWAVE